MDQGLMAADLWDRWDTCGTLVGHQNADVVPIVLYCPISPIPFKKKNIFLEIYRRSVGELLWDRRDGGGRSL